MWIVLCLLLLLSIRSNNDVFTIPFKKKPVLSAAPIKLLSYNISLFSGEKNYRQIVDFIFNTDADIVCLQEFGYYNHASKLSAAAIVSLFEQKYPYHHIWYKNQNRMASWGAATFSKHPIVHKHKIEYDSRFNISIYSDIILGGDTVRVMNNHLESNKLTMRDFKEYHNDNKDRSEFMNVSVMMSEKLGAAYIIRAKQARVVANEIQASPYPVVVCGDFNDVPTSYAYQTIKKGLIDAYTATGWGYRYTYYQNGMLVGIDHVLLDKHFAPVSCRIVHTGFSDHYPVIAEWVHKRQ
jgi:endonuclease/exonuclease/phosphatase family metal-dependent hydrolase